MVVFSDLVLPAFDLVITHPENIGKAFLFGCDAIPRVFLQFNALLKIHGRVFKVVIGSLEASQQFWKTIERKNLIVSHERRFWI